MRKTFIRVLIVNAAVQFVITRQRAGNVLRSRKGGLTVDRHHSIYTRDAVPTQAGTLEDERERYRPTPP